MNELTKEGLITLLKESGVEDVSLLESPEVRKDNLILFIKKYKLNVNPRFFARLADELGLPSLEDQKLKGKSHLASAFPYSMLKENLVFLLEIAPDTVKIATANPLNRKFFALIESIFKRRIELYVASIRAIDEAIEDGYREIHKRRALEELRDRSPDESAYTVLYPWQKLSLIFTTIIFFLFLIWNPRQTLLNTFLIINIIYIITNPVKFYILFRAISGSRKEASISDKDLRKLDDRMLPIYTILIPLYREAHVLAHIIENVYNLDYPNDRLDVKIIMEEEDNATLEEAKRLGLFGKPDKFMPSMLPAGHMEFLKTFEPVVVPKADIRTKPRACNFGLLRARGEYVVIYDAEDDPDRDQLKKALLAFERSDNTQACFQARLNYYNPRENILTRWFTIEYSFWFDYYLQGLDYIGSALPLGGTSNHFKTKQLRALGGWDPYNVTEDADLGIRLTRKRLKTGILDSYTYEESNSRIWNWVRQRSRWNKGYIQTYLVHMRHPRKLLEDLGWRKFLFFQLTFGGNIYMPLVNPLLWIITTLTLLAPQVFQFSLLYPMGIVCTFNLVIGNLVYILVHLIACLKDKKYDLAPFALLIPFYWVLISVGAWKGFLQLITRPHHWEKTMHGISQVYKRGESVKA